MHVLFAHFAHSLPISQTHRRGRHSALHELGSSVIRHYMRPSCDLDPAGDLLNWPTHVTHISTSFVKKTPPALAVAVTHSALWPTRRFVPRSLAVGIGFASGSVFFQLHKAVADWSVSLAVSPTSASRYDCQARDNVMIDPPSMGTWHVWCVLNGTLRRRERRRVFREQMGDGRR